MRVIRQRELWVGKPGERMWCLQGTENSTYGWLTGEAEWGEMAEANIRRVL